MKEEIVQKAAAYVLEHGLANESIRNIAQKIGTSHRMINYHFGSSEWFWEALINEIRSIEVERSRQYLAAQRGGHQENIARAWSYFSTPEYQKIFALIFEIYARVIRAPHEHQAFVQSFVDQWLQLLSTSMAEQYDLPTDEARRYARLRLACIRGLMLDLLLTQDQQGVADAAQLLDQLFAAQLKR